MTERVTDKTRTSGFSIPLGGALGGEAFVEISGSLGIYDIDPATGVTSRRIQRSADLDLFTIGPATLVELALGSPWVLTTRTKLATPDVQHAGLRAIPFASDEAELDPAPGGITFPAPVPARQASSPYLAYWDVDGNGVVDLLAAPGRGRVLLYRGSGAPGRGSGSGRRSRGRVSSRAGQGSSICASSQSSRNFSRTHG